MITLSTPQTGISRSPHVGFGDVRNLDMNSVRGVAKLNTITVKRSATTVDAQVWWIVQNPNAPANFYALDANGVVYNSADSGVTWAELSDRAGSGQGLIVWKDYLFVAETTTIDVYGPLSGAPAWTDNWQTITTDALWHPMIVSKNDGKIYGGAGRFIFSVDENTGQNFAPGTAGTYTFTAEALDLPEDYRIKCLEELGNNLMIGTWQGTNIYDVRKANIFPWDRSAVSFGQPVVMNEFGVHAMRNDGNSLVVLAGIDGTIFRCDGVNAIPIGQMPQDLSGGKYLEFYPGSICNYKNKIFFGVGQGGTTATAGMGVYSLEQTSRGNILLLEHLVSTLSDGTTNPLKPTALAPITRDTMLIGWRDNTTYGIDSTSATSYAYTTDYSGYYDSPLFEVGNDKNKMKPTEIEIRLGRPLRTGEGIRLSYRLDLSATFTTIKTLAFADNGVGAITTKTFTVQIPDNIKQAEQLQIRVALKGTATTTTEIKQVIIR